jgi:hypothetical protein
MKDLLLPLTSGSDSMPGIEKHDSFIREILQPLQEKEWAKVLAVTKDGKPTVATLGAKSA